MIQCDLSHRKNGEMDLESQIWVPCSSGGRESAYNAGDPSSIPGLGRYTEEGIGYPFQYSWASLWLSGQRIHLQCRRPGFDPWVGRIPWRRERLQTPVFWPGKFYGLHSSWSHKQLDKTKRLSHFLGNWDKD